ncbi:relA-associated inhibitor isoform X3 [Cebidichthys violaceus]|uniref:relA-associated inhibitor isoform X3 n=1 Tax=Cebidichthys violaceus TaxID=271503 RepID=UPI0035CB4ED0
MSSPASLGSNMLFQTINDDLNASLATADELSREFNSLLKEASSDNNNTKSQVRTYTPPAPVSSSTSSAIFREKPQPLTPITARETRASSNGSFNKPFSPSSTTFHSLDSVFSSNKIASSPPTIFTSSPLSSPKIQRESHSPLPRAGSDIYSYGQPSPKLLPHTPSPKHSPHTPRRHSPSRYDRSPQGSASYTDRSPSPSPTAVSSDLPSRSTLLLSSSNQLSPYDSSTMGRRSPRQDRVRSPLSFNNHISNTLPRNFAAFRKPDEGVQQQQKSSETEWLRPPLPSSWRESNLDGPPPAPSPKKDPRSPSLIYSHTSLPRNTRITVPPDVSSPVHSPYHPQPIISRISIPPTSTQSHQHKPIPLSVIMRLQNPHWGAMSTRHPRVQGGEGDMAPYQPPVPFPNEFFHQHVPQPPQHPPELRQPAVYSDALNSGDIDAELERLDFVHNIPVISENPSVAGGRREGASQAPRPLSPTRLQPVVAPEAQRHDIPDLEEVLRMRAEIPRALKRRGSVDQSQPLKRASHYQPNQYKNLIDKLFRRKDQRQRGERGSETSSSSDGEEAAPPPAPLPAPTMHPDFRSYHSILRRSKRDHKSSGRRARLSPLVLLLDGALVGELEIVQKAMQEMNDPSQPNDEGITALHNGICGGHYNVVDFLVRIGANVSAPDSHGWTPLHCSASCNDRPLCEFLVRNGAAVMAMTESDGATASQKCDPYAVGFEECESFLKGVEAAMGTENSGVLYALWSYPAQAADELSFKEGDMVTILQKPEGSDWWWASLCGREGFVPDNYFGLFPKVRPKSLC